MKLPERKNIRLKYYDYTQAGYYYITICTYNRECLLSSIVAGGFHAAPLIELSTIGKEITKTIEYINDHYDGVKIDKYAIMPNHIHLIIVLKQRQLGRYGNLPLHKIVGQLKSYTNREYNTINGKKDLTLWQRNYYEHIIRNETEYREIWEYIDTNPLKWQEDEYFI